MQINWLALEAISTAIGAIATISTAIIAALVLFREIPKYRREVTTKRVEGLRYVGDQLRTKGFLKSSDTLYSVLPKKLMRIDELPDGTIASARFVLSTLEFLDKLIELEYIDTELLLFVYSEEIAGLFLAFEKIMEIKGSGDMLIPLINEFPRGFKFLQKAGEEVEEKRSRAIDEYEVSKYYKERSKNRQSDRRYSL